MKHRLAPVLIAATLAPPLSAEEAPPGLVCRVEGYDVALINGGEAAIPEGTVIAWSVERTSGRKVVVAPSLGSTYPTVPTFMELRPDVTTSPASKSPASSPRIPR